ncbi:SidA/IucD/PvdA family monooxygenase [Pseudomonas sp. BEA3.1]|uniref:SidA/IucD/PvdA family monooxygenase n=1 Tax=Pseudomonas sp. BEA3.1 TaxID=3083251 RepID=UPI00296467B6|nr:SidA/IucD/PvdA family monooxygenase [Pseudomonas sp. BEA3.1]MDW2775985.1 SidA/IucD/PvdA family monooxygenase [Pseudomonas sp. BEA3.1]
MQLLQILVQRSANFRSAGWQDRKQGVTQAVAVFAEALQVHRGLQVGAGQYAVVALDALFIDKQQDYHWHGETLATQSELQISFLKDLVSLRTPTSPYSFVNYQHQKTRQRGDYRAKAVFRSGVHGCQQGATHRASGAFGQARANGAKGTHQDHKDAHQQCCLHCPDGC